MATKITTLTRFAPLLLALPLAACSVLPTYTPAGDKPSITVKVLGMGKPQVCVGNQLHSVNVTHVDGYPTFKVAAGERITLRTFMHYQGYNVSSHCHPAISVVPKAGSTLLLNSGLDGNACFIEAVREDNSVETGVSLETSLGAPQC